MLNEEDSATGSQAGAAENIVIRNAPWCALWLVLVTTGGAALVIVLSSGAPPESLAALVLFVFYALQGLIAESIGVKVFDDHISAPWRFRRFPSMIVSWRRKVPMNGLLAVASMPRQREGECVHLHGARGGLRLIFSSRREKRLFCRTVQEFCPQLRFDRIG